MSCSNSRAFDRAEREYLTPPEDYLEDCKSCDGAHFMENEDTGEFDVECEDCDDSGQVDGRAYYAKKRQEYLEEKGERDFQEQRDRKLEKD